MPLKEYGVLKARVKSMRASTDGHPHYHLWLHAEGKDYRASINVRSMLHPSEVEYAIQLRMRHPITRRLTHLTPGYHSLRREPNRLALDYIRLNIVDPDEFLVLPCEGPLCGADLNEVLDGVLLSAMSDPDAWIYVFGEPWAADASDRIFRFYPSHGMHEIHMNQGNDPSHWKQDGVWQDGAILIEHPKPKHWKGIFLKFQSQSWHTDDIEGHPLTPPASYGKEWKDVPLDRNGYPRPDGMVRIIAAMVGGEAQGKGFRESVTLLNVCPFPIPLQGWSLANGQKKRWRLKGTLEAGQTVEVTLGASVPLADGGGTITLLNREGMKVHGVSFTPEQMCPVGWRITF